MGTGRLGLLVERYDETAVPVWYICDPAHPEAEPVRQRYPQAGKANAVVSLHWVPLDGSRVDVDWRSDRELDGAVYEYLAEVHWASGPPIIVVLTRDQRRMEFREVDVESGVSSTLRAFVDDCWVELMEGTPRRTKDGRLLHAVIADDTYRLALDDTPFTPVGLQVRGVLAVEDDAVIASVVPKAASISVARLGFDGSATLLSDPEGVALGEAAGGTTVVQYRSLADFDIVTAVSANGSVVGTIEALNERPPLRLNVSTMQLGARDYPTTVVFPSWHEPGSRQLPVLMDPYGGPHGQRVVAAHNAHLASQWFADQGFAVIVADGRGTPGRCPAGRRRSRATSPGCRWTTRSRRCTQLARERTRSTWAGSAIRGWSYGGYLAGAGGAAPPGRLPRGGRRRPGHRPAAVRHALHRALPRPPGRAPRGLRGELA